MRIRHGWILCLFVGACVGTAGQKAHAEAGRVDGGVSLSKTRVIFQEGMKSALLGIRNTASHAWLTQVSVVDEKGNNATPFTVLPPLFRLEPGSEHDVRILAGSAMGDGVTEQVRYVRVLSIPPLPVPAPGDETKYQVNVSLESVIKLFWRPHGLPAPDNHEFGNVSFTAVSGGINACNPGRYYLSFNRLSVDGVAVDLNRAPSMLSPGKCEVFPVKGSSVRWSMINDYGGESQIFSASVSSRHSPL